MQTPYNIPPRFTKGPRPFFPVTPPTATKTGSALGGPTDHPFSHRRLCLGQPLPTCPLLQAQDIDSRPITDKTLPTPVQVENLNRWLQGYGKERHSLIEGFTFGFDLGFEGIAKNVVCNNLKLASEFPKLVQEKISQKLRLWRTAGPFGTPPFETFVTSPLGVIPKKDSGAYRMIQHLSHPPGVSINDGIPFEKASVQYQTINHASDHVKNIGRGSYMAKTDIAKAFRIIPIKPSQYHLMGIHWQGLFYYDRCLAMGLHSSCSIFEQLSTAIHWIAVHQLGIEHMVHFIMAGLSSFLTFGAIQHHLYTDASGFLGYGAVYGSRWLYGAWSDEWKGCSITLLELYPTVLAVTTWGALLANHCIRFHTNNLALVSIINHQTSRDKHIMHLVRRLVSTCERTNKTERRPEEQSEKAESCQENLRNEIQFKGS